MSWSTLIWSGAGGAALTLGLIHFFVWFCDRTVKSSLWFSGVAGSVAFIAVVECLIMREASVERFIFLHRLGHVAFFVTSVCVVGFVHAYLRAPLGWLGGAFIVVRSIVLLMNFIPGPTFNFREVSEMVPYDFLGEVLHAPRGLTNPWEPIGEASGLLLVAFVIRSGIQLWRKGSGRERQRAIVVVLGIILFLGSCIVNGTLVHGGVAQFGVSKTPYFITLSFMFIVGSMGAELSRDLMQAARMADELRENAESMSLAAGASQLALWRWDIASDRIWVSPGGRALYGIPEEEGVDLPRFLTAIHEGDRRSTELAVQESLAGDGNYGAEYRVVLPDGAIRWIGARGRVEFDRTGEPQRMRGVSLDITERRAAELRAEQHRSELAHLTRVSTLSELSGSLAHELNQPLAIILSNAQAAKRLLASNPLDVAEIDDILADIIEADRRAGEVIQRLRALLKRGETVSAPVSLNKLIEEVLRLARGDLMVRGVAIVRELQDDLPEVCGDRVQLQQVMLNLLLNGAEAMSQNPAGQRRLRIQSSSRDGRVSVAVRDEGPGLTVDSEKLFQPFYTTKPQGLGMGLAICRAIVRAHGGSLDGRNIPEGGAAFVVEIPVRKGGEHG